MTSREEIFARVAAEADLGRASAAKRGRNPRWPYVPIIDHSATRPLSPTTQLRGLAFATRAEAVACAEEHIARLRARLETELAEPRYRALREWHGLPRELEEVGQ